MLSLYISIAWFRRDEVFFMLCMDTGLLRIMVVRKTTSLVIGQLTREP